MKIDIARLFIDTTTTALEGFLLLVAPSAPGIRAIEHMAPDDFAIIGCGTPRTSDDVIALLPYKNRSVKTALIELKTHRNRRVANILGAVLFDGLKSRADSGTIIIPIPITRAKRVERGWNQCELVLGGLKKVDRTGMFEVRTDILVKIRETPDQVGKSRAERFENLRDSFAVRSPAAIAGRSVIVFDDILTTGATLGEARRALLAAGARAVICVALAH